MFGDDAAGNETEYGRIETKIDDNMVLHIHTPKNKNNLDKAFFSVIFCFLLNSHNSTLPRIT